LQGFINEKIKAHQDTANITMKSNDFEIILLNIYYYIKNPEQALPEYKKTPYRHFESVRCFDSILCEAAL